VTLTADPARRTERALAAAQANLKAGALIAEDDAVCEATGASTAPYPRDAAGFATGREAEALRLPWGECPHLRHSARVSSSRCARAAAGLLRYQLDQRSRLSCPPSRPLPGHRERLTAAASRSPHTLGTSSGCRRLGLPACRISSTAQGRPFAGFRSFVSAPRCARMTGICGPVAPRVQIRRLGDAIGGMLAARRGPKRLRRHCSCVCLAEAQPAAVIDPPRTAGSACGGQSAAWANLRA
jgi:hypothetical protein